MIDRWDDVRVFLAAHEHGSLSAAARILGVEQSTVSRRVAALEDALGAPLFIRSRSGLMLTELGERVLPLARDVQRTMLELRDATSSSVEGVVRIALTQGMACHALIPALDELYAMHPGLSVKLVTSFSMSDLSRREADVALRYARPEHDELVYRRCGEFDFTVWGAPRWSDAPTHELDWIALDLGPIPSPSAPLERALGRPPVLIADDYLSVIAAIESGLGVGVLPRLLGEELEGLVELDVEAPMIEPLTLYLVGHTSNRHTPRVAAVWTFLEQWIERMFAARLKDTAG